MTYFENDADRQNEEFDSYDYGSEKSCDLYSLDTGDSMTKEQEIEWILKMEKIYGEMQ